MKQLYIYILLLILPAVLPGKVASQVTPGDPGNFITTWKTDNTGTSDIDQIIIPTTGIGYDYDVYWEDINDASINGVVNNVSGDLTITFPGAGSYQVEISGAFPQIYFYNDNNPSDAGKLLSIEQWGSIAWLSMQQAFYGCSNLQVTATDAPDLTQVTSMFEMFSGASSLNADFNSWDVSNITDMSGLFSGAQTFNGAIGSWDVSNVQLMGGMFFNAHAFNQPIGGWNVGNVTNMINTFSFAMSFNQPLENWNVGNVMVMGGMFRSTPFNQDIGGWDVSNVTNLQSMFSGANAFDQDISGWNVSGVTNMRQLFQNAAAFNQDLGGWNIGSVTDMEEMLDNTALSILNYDATLVGWEGQSIQQNVPFGAQGLEYCAGEAARDELINTHGWTITGDAKSASTCINPFSFITVWSTNDNQFTVPTFSGETYDYDVYWKSLLNPAIEGTLSGQTGDAVINVPTAGIYEVEITGLFPRIYFNNGGDKEKLASVEQWGNNAWTSMEAAFFGCSNLEINATDDPNLSGVTSMSEMFRAASSLNSDLNDWNVSNVTNMDRMFQGATVYNGNITGWDVSGVTDMLAMFTSAQAFDQNIGGWNVSNVVNMGAMFAGASAFNQDISGWNVSNVASMSAMFQAANSFNQPINSWNVSNVTDMSFMFNTNSTFNQPIGGWDVSNVTTMFGMFWGAGAFDQDISGWNVSSLENMHSMFEDAVQFNQDIGNWNVSNVTNMIQTFSGAVSFNQDIGGWNVGNVIAVGHMFEGSVLFNQDLGNWDVSNVTNMLGMFQGASSFDQDLGDWDISNVTGMGDMLNGSALSVTNYDATLIGWAGQSVQPNVPLGAAGLEYCAGEAARDELINNHSWSISGDTKFSGTCVNPFSFVTVWSTNDNQITVPTFNGETYNYDVLWRSLVNPAIEGTLTGVTGDAVINIPTAGIYQVEISGLFPRIYFNNGGDKEKLTSIEQWGAIAWTSMEKAFFGCSNLQVNATDAPDLSGVTEVWGMFEDATTLNADLNHWDVSTIVNMARMFAGATSFNGNITDWNVAQVTSFGVMFQGAPVFNQPIGNWDVSNAVGTPFMFSGASAFDQDIGSWDVSQVTDMTAMFANTPFNQNIGNWNVSNVTWMEQMFNSAMTFNQDITTWDVSNVSNMNGMFTGAAAFNQPIGNWNVSNVQDMGFMFYQASAFNQPLENWDVGNVENMAGMFAQATVFNQNLNNWDVSNVTTMDRMFYFASNYHPPLDNWNIGNVTDMTQMLDGTSLNVFSYDATLIGWAGQSVQPNVPLGAAGLEYCAAEEARADLLGTHGWNITGDAISPSCSAFITLWNTNNDGTSNNDQITIPTTGSGYNYDVYWENFNDPTNNGTLSGLTGTTTITFPASGLYRVEITGDFPRIFFNNTGDKEKILEINQWGDIAWTSMNSAFWGCTNLQLKALDAPDLSGVSTLSLMFANAVTLDADLNHWDVSQVTDMFATFFGASSFNGDVSGWDVSNVTKMASAFKLAANFNQDIGLWNVGNVGDMSEMFYDAAAFNQDLDNWDTSNVQTMAYLFAGALAFDGVIGNWNTDSVTDMNNMFNSASVFNQDIGNWNITSVTDMEQMLDNSGLSTANYDATLIGWAGQSVQQNVPLGADGLEYCAGEAARNELINTHSWTITGDALQAGCDPLTGSDQRVLAGNQSDYMFPGSDFGIGNPAFSVKIEALPAGGTLLFEGNPVSAGDEILAADLNDGKLTWDAGTNSHGYEFTSFDFRIVDDMNNESNDAYTMSIDLAAAAVELTGGEGWRFMTSPAPGETFSGFLNPIWTQGIPGSNNPGAANPNLFRLDQINYQWEAVGGMSEAIGQGEGFLVYVFDDNNNNGTPDGFPKTLTSLEQWEPLDGTFSYSGLFYDPNQGPEGDSHFLVANPHPISLDFCEFSEMNIAGAVSVWDPAANGGNGDYIDLNCATDNVHIAPFQAFWIQTLAVNPSLGIPEGAYLSGQANGYFKENSPLSRVVRGVSSESQDDLSLVELSIQSIDGIFTNRVRLLFGEENPGELARYNTTKLSPSSLAPRWLSFHALDEEHFGYAFRTLQSLNALKESLKISLGLETTESGDFELSWKLPKENLFTAGWYLKDNHTGQVTELRDGQSYRFEINASSSVHSKWIDDSQPGVLNSGSGVVHSSVHGKWTDEGPRFELLVTAPGVDGRSELGDLPDQIILNQNYPNPFNPTTVISYELPQAGDVLLEVYDMLGRKVVTLVDNQVSSGRHSVSFDGANLASGVYMYRLQVQRTTGDGGHASGTVMTRQLTLIK